MTEKMTLSEMFKGMSQLQCGSTMAHSIKVYRIPHNNLGDVKVILLADGEGNSGAFVNDDGVENES